MPPASAVLFAAINLFQVLDHISLSDGFFEFHVVPDRNRTTDFEVFELEAVTGYGTNAADEQEFRPFYLAKDTDTGLGAYYTTNRVPRMLTANERQTGKKSSYAGTELFLSLVDANCAPAARICRLGSRLCANRPCRSDGGGVGRTVSRWVCAPVMPSAASPAICEALAAEGHFFGAPSAICRSTTSPWWIPRGDGRGQIAHLLKLYIRKTIAATPDRRTPTVVSNP
jgi:type VI secretion system protein ImpG